MTLVIRPARTSIPVVELLRQERSRRAQRLLCVLLVVDEGDGVQIGERGLAHLMRCQLSTLRPAIADLVDEGLLDVFTPPYTPELAQRASTYRLSGLCPSVPLVG